MNLYDSNGNAVVPKGRNEPKNVPHLSTPAMVVQFDMGEDGSSYEIAVPNIEFKEPRIPKGASPLYASRLMDFAIEANLKKRAEADKLRRLIRHHAEVRHNIRIVSDPTNFLESDDELDDMERGILGEQNAKEVAAVADLDFTAAGNSRSKKVGK